MSRWSARMMTKCFPGSLIVRCNSYYYYKLYKVNCPGLSYASLPHALLESKTGPFDLENIVTISIRIMTQPVQLPWDSQLGFILRQISRERPESVKGGPSTNRSSRMKAGSSWGSDHYWLQSIYPYRLQNEPSQDGASNLQKDIIECSDDGTLILPILIPCMYLSIISSTLLLNLQDFCQTVKFYRWLQLSSHLHSQMRAWSRNANDWNPKAVAEISAS